MAGERPTTCRTPNSAIKPLNWEKRMARYKRAAVKTPLKRKEDESSCWKQAQNIQLAINEPGTINFSKTNVL